MFHQLQPCFSWDFPAGNAGSGKEQQGGFGELQSRLESESQIFLQGRKSLGPLGKFHGCHPKAGKIQWISPKVGKNSMDITPKLGKSNGCHPKSGKIPPKTEEPLLSQEEEEEDPSSHSSKPRNSVGILWEFCGTFVGILWEFQEKERPRFPSIVSREEGNSSLPVYPREILE